MGNNENDEIRASRYVWKIFRIRIVICRLRNEEVKFDVDIDPYQIMKSQMSNHYSYLEFLELKLIRYLNENVVKRRQVKFDVDIDGCQMIKFETLFESLKLKFVRHSKGYKNLEEFK